MFPGTDLAQPRPEDEEPRFEDSFRIPLRSEVSIADMQRGKR